jgi:integrase
MREAERLLAVARKPEGDQLVFTDQWRQPLHGRHITERRLSAVLRKADLRRIRFHDLRHTAATLMLLQGVNPKVVSEMLGHTTVEMTLDTYSHVLPTMQ